MVRRLHVAGMAYGGLSIRHMQGNVRWFPSVYCVCVYHCHWQGEGARRWMFRMEENSELRSTKVSSSGKTQNHRPSPGGSDRKADWKK